MTHKAVRRPARTPTDDPPEASGRVCCCHVVQPRCNACPGTVRGSEGREASTGRATRAMPRREARTEASWHDTCGRDDETDVHMPPGPLCGGSGAAATSRDADGTPPARVGGAASAGRLEIERERDPHRPIRCVMAAPSSPEGSADRRHPEC